MEKKMFRARFEQLKFILNTEKVILGEFSSEDLKSADVCAHLLSND